MFLPFIFFKKNLKQHDDLLHIRGKNIGNILNIKLL